MTDSLPATDDPLRTPACTDCSGLGATVAPCSCTATGERILSDYNAEPGATDPLPDCKRCHGSGSRTFKCHTCDGTGAIRAQLVITVVNIDVGTIASETILPGVIEPEWIQSELDDGPRWALPLAPVIDRLITAAGGTLIETHANTMSLARSLTIPGNWSPELPPDARLGLEAAAIARTQALTRHRHFFTTTTAPAIPADPQARLAHLAQIADRLHLDLCCYRYVTISDELDRPTKYGWSLAFELPGVERPAPRASNLSHASLAEALEAAEALELLKHLRFHRDAANPAPARFVGDTAGLAPALPVGMSIEALAGQIASRTDDLRGAAAIRRDGTWHFATLEPDKVLEEARETDTGQVRHRRRRTWRRTPAPPPPAWWGDPVPDRPCPQCATGTTWVACDCFLTLTDAPDPLCDRCTGTGFHTATHCALCGQIGRIRYGYVVTIADLAPGGAAHHYNINPGLSPEHEPRPWPVMPEVRRHQLPDRLTRRLAADGIDLADLREVTGVPLAPELLDGGVLAPESTPMVDLVCQHVTATAAGRPGARIILAWTPPPAATVAQAASIAWGLGLDLVLAAEDRSSPAIAGTALAGMRWGAALLRLDDEPDRNLTGAFGKRRLSIALHDLIEQLPHQRNIATASKPGPLDVVPAPQQTEPPRISGAERLEAALSGLASRHGGPNAHTIVARLHPRRVTIARLTAGAEQRFQPVVPLAKAPTLAEALTLLDPAEPQ